MAHVLLPTPNPLNKLLSGSHQSIDESNHSFPPVSCSSIPTNPGYFASYSFFDHVQVPCVLFAGSAIGVKRHHGIIPFGEKDIDIACWSDDWVKDHTLIEATLDAIFPNWYVSLQGYYVPIKGSSHFLDIWLHGPSVNSISKEKAIDLPSRCIGHEQDVFNSYAFHKILPELAYYFLKKPNKIRKKFEWTKFNGTKSTCFTFYQWFYKGYAVTTWKNKEIRRGLPPIWPSNMFFSSKQKQTRLFGNRLMPVPVNMNKYVNQRYGDVMRYCGRGSMNKKRQAIRTNTKCTSLKWSKYG